MGMCTHSIMLNIEFGPVFIYVHAGLQNKNTARDMYIIQSSIPFFFLRNEIRRKTKITVANVNKSIFIVIIDITRGDITSLQSSVDNKIIIFKSALDCINNCSTWQS